MSRLLSLITFLSLLAAGVAVAPVGVLAQNRDATIVQVAAVRLGHESPRRVVRWLRGQLSVRSAYLARDRATVDLRFRDGGNALILPRMASTNSVARPLITPRLLPLARVSSPTAPRALVLEPFATELNLPPNAGDPEVSVLKAAGFQVDQASDAQVTVATMATLAQYNVVYMHTHTSPDGVVATGQQVSCQPYTSPDGTVITVGVAGSTQCYSAITAKYIAANEPRFSAHSIIFVNGCALLNSGFWPALSAKGAGAMLSWDNDSATYDDYLSAAAFFNQMGQGMSISDALNALHAANYGTSMYQGKTATLGFQGDGSITLKSVGGSTPSITPTPTPSATRTPRSTVTPSPTRTPTTPPGPRPTATATPIPTRIRTPSVVLALARSAVKPGVGQVITVRNLTPGSSTEASVTFPNGDVLPVRGMADEHGVAQLRFVQPGSKITRHGHEATVTVTGTSPAGPYGLRQQYRVGYGAIDVSVQPRRQAPGKVITIWVHTSKRTAVKVALKGGGRKFASSTRKTGAHGWMKWRVPVPRRVAANQVLVVRVRATRGHRVVKSSTTFLVS